MNAVKFLGQIRKLNLIIRNKEIEKEQWLAVAESTTASSKSVLVKLSNGNYEYQGMERVQSSGNSDKMVDAIIKTIDIEAEIEAEKVRLQQKKESIIRVIEQLPSDQYSVLHLIYVQGFTLKIAAYEEGRSYGWAKKQHREGIKNVQKILDERKTNENKA